LYLSVSVSLWTLTETLTYPQGLVTIILGVAFLFVSLFLEKATGLHE